MPGPGCPTLYKPADRTPAGFAEAAQQGLRAPLSRMSGSAHPTRQRKPEAERAGRAETSNPWEIAAFSTMARPGGNPAETGGNPLQGMCSGNCPGSCRLTHGVQSIANG